LAVENGSAPSTRLASLGAVWIELNQIPTRSGIDFENSNKIAAVSFNFFPGGNLAATYSRLLKVAGLRPVYNKIKGNFFAILMEGVGFSAYSRYQAIGSGIIGFTISWAQDDAQNACMANGL
jgi:hypothetical protein